MFRHPSEKLAISFLEKNQFLIIDHNVIINLENKKVEIDIVAYYTPEPALHFVEVKEWNTKRPLLHPVLKEIQKRKELLMVACREFLRKIKETNGYRERKDLEAFFRFLETHSLWEIPVSFDLIWIQHEKIHHYKNIFFGQ